MTLEKRITVLSICIGLIVFADVFLSLIDLLEGSSVMHIALLYGAPMIVVVVLAASSRARLKKELLQRSTD